MADGKAIANLEFPLGCHYDFFRVKFDDAGNEVSRERIENVGVHGKVHNLITNAGMDNIAGITSGNFIAANCVVGTGTIAPANSDTNLTTFLAGTNTVQTPEAKVNQISTVPYYIDSTITYRFAAGVATGNVSEVGICTNIPTNNPVPTNANTLFSHALITDDSGNPTVISILSNEALDVQYTLRVFYPNNGTPLAGSFNAATVHGVVTTINYTMTTGLLETFAAGIKGQLFAIPQYFGQGLLGGYILDGGTSTNAASATGSFLNNSASNKNWDTMTRQAYAAGSYNINVFHEMQLNSSNFAIRTFSVGTQFALAFQFQMSASITKTNADIFDLTITYTWARA